MKRMILAALAMIALTTTPAAAQYYNWGPQPGTSMTYEQSCRVEYNGYGAPPMTVCPPQGGYYSPPQQYGGYYPPPPQYGGYPPQGGYMRPTGCRNDQTGQPVPLYTCDQFYGRGGGYGGYPPPPPYHGDRRGHFSFTFAYRQ